MHRLHQIAVKQSSQAMKVMTIRNIPSDLGEMLEQEKQRRGTSLNRTVLALLREALGLTGVGPRSNGLRRMAGTWNEGEYREFEKAVAPFGEIDEAIWR